MSSTDIVRAWKNEDYMMALSAPELAAVPANPAGNIELSCNSIADGSRSVSFGLPQTRCCSVVIECSASNCA
jgi:mersacidin/lichenicidin family type 2 lantibiotic